MTARYSSLLLFLLFIKLIVLGWYIHTGFIGLGPDEAQYWTWSQDLDWGYYSKPPGIAFQIKLGTWLFGNTELGVRFGSLLLSVAIALAIYLLAYLGGLTVPMAFWAAVAYAFSPIGIMGSLLAITDVGMFLAWTLACCPIAYSLATGKPPYYIWVGLAIAVGALFKWPIYLLWVAILLGMMIFPILRQRSFFSGVFVSLLGLTPPLMWNIQHNWMTFRHVGSTLIGKHIQELGTTGLFKGNALEFLGAQAVLLSPVLFILLIVGWGTVLPRLLQDKISALVRWGAFTSFVGLSVCLGIACFQKMQGNWCIFIYPLVMPILAWKSLMWCKRGVIVSVVCVAALLSIPLLSKINIQIPIKYHPFKHNMDWDGFPKLLSRQGYNPTRHFLFADTYQMTSLLSFYSPFRKRAYFFNLEGARHNQFDVWPGMQQEQKRKTGYFALADRSALEIETKTQQLADYFKNVTYLGKFPLKPHSQKHIHLWKCVYYQGELPKGTALY